jgi:carbonic anhydrase/acetyltransferase-like protein (isoleucine patch superfamily)
MLVEHRGAQPHVDPTAYVAPTAVLCGDVRIGPQARVLWNAVLTAEDGSVEIGARTVVMEQALVRGRAGTPARIGDDVLIGPHAHVNGAEIGAGSFIATGASLFPGARIGTRGVVRINGIVHVKSTLPDEGLVPIGWVAVGDPAQVLSPDRHEEISAILTDLDFHGTVYGVARSAARERMERQSAWFGAHRDDRILG